MDCVCQWMLSKLSCFCEFQFTPFKSAPSGLACSPQGLGLSSEPVSITCLTCLSRLFQVLLLYTKKKGKKPQTKQKALASVANFPSSVKITLVALSNLVSFSQGSRTEIIQCLFLYKFSQCYNVLETSWDVSSFFTG